MNELDWLSSRQDIIGRNEGKWVVIDVRHDKVFSHIDLDRAVDEFKKEHPSEIPACFKVPRQDEEVMLL